MSKATNQLSKFTLGLSNAVKEAIDRVQMDRLGKFTVDLIVKRTRLGYGVDANNATKSPLARLSDKYVKRRKTFADLSATTRPKKSNLTLTGQMLASVQHKYKSKGVVIIEPTGTRRDGQKNLDIAKYNAERSPSRIFNRISGLEFAQIMRYYRKTFGDLVKKSSKGRLIR
jgi:hypothetical protein